MVPESSPDVVMDGAMDDVMDEAMGCIDEAMIDHG